MLLEEQLLNSHRWLGAELDESLPQIRLPATHALAVVPLQVLSSWIEVPREVQSELERGKVLSDEMDRSIRCPHRS